VWECLHSDWRSAKQVRLPLHAKFYLEGANWGLHSGWPNYAPSLVIGVFTIFLYVCHMGSLL